MRKSECLKTMAALLMHGYRGSSDFEQKRTLTDRFLSNLEIMQPIALENRIWSNLLGTLFEDRQLFETLPAHHKKFFQTEYFLFLRRADLIQKQVDQLSTALGENGTPNVLLFKGAVLLFDDLYPTPIHRFFRDIDLYTEDPKTITILAELGYETTQETTLSIADLNADFFAQNRKGSHQLPSLRHNDYRAQIEVHHFLSSLRSKRFLPPDAASFDFKIAKAPSFSRPSQLNQLIIALVHYLYCDQESNNINYRLRGLIESYFLYQTLTPSDVKSLDQHFESIGKARDLIFWKYQCQTLLGAQEFSIRPTLSCRVRYKIFLSLNQSKAFQSASYFAFFTFRFVTHSIWQKSERKRLVYKLSNASQRAVFFKKFRNALGLQ